MPSFDEIFDEAHRLALEWGHPTIADHIAKGRDPGGENRTTYEALMDRAYKNLCDREWDILQVTAPQQAKK